MAATVTQDIPGTYVAGKRAELRYTILGAADEAAAKTALDAVRPLAFNSIPCKESTITADHFDSNNTAGNIFRAAVLYFNDPVEVEHLISFDTTGGTSHITQSFGTTSYPTGSAPDTQNVIGIGKDGVAGVDIGIAAMTFTERHYKSLADVSEAYKNILALFTYTTNNAVFRGYDIGEVLFKGAVGQKVVKDGTTQWQIDYTFAVKKNLSNITVGDITGIAKPGWGHVWYSMADHEDETSHWLLKRPVYVHVEKVYESTDFSQLAL